MRKFIIKFMPDNLSVSAESGQTLLEAAAAAGIEVKSTCGGAGTCGRCLVRVTEGNFRTEQTGNLSDEKVKAGYVLACQTYPEGDLVVEIPDESRLSMHQVLLENNENAPEEQFLGYTKNPICKKIKIQVDEPTLTDNTSDLTRLQVAVRKMIGKDVKIGLDNIKILAEMLRENDWKITATLAELGEEREIIHLEPGWTDKPPYGLAIDIGTTTVVVYLVDMNSGLTIDKAGTYNKQARFGDDVISRMIHAVENEEGLEELRDAVVSTINELVGQLLKKYKLDKKDIVGIVAAGNTTMTHLFLGISPKYIRLEPYIPTANSVPVVKAKEIGLEVNPNAWVLNFPAIGSYVGGDIVSGTLVTDIINKEELTLFIDIGTNGEMVLGNSEWMVSCACSAGPAFEGGGITFGMRAMQGAIERVNIDPSNYEIEVSAIGGSKPVGICGSGLIDLLAKMRRTGLIDRTGQFARDIKTPRLRENDGEWEYVLVWAEESGIGKDIIINESDIKNLIRSKGAIYAGIRSMLAMVQMDISMIDKVLIAGGFGNYLNIGDSIEIGLLPDLPLEKFSFIGNSSVQGARLALMSQDAFIAAESIAQTMTYIELSLGNTFMDEYVSALFLPHTDLTLFPSLKY